MLMETNNLGCSTETTLVSERVRVHEDWVLQVYVCVCVCVLVFLTLPVTAGAEPDVQAAQ